MDFIIGSKVKRKSFRIFNLIDDCNREVLAMEIDTSLSSKRIVRILERVILESSSQALLKLTMDQSFLQTNFSFGQKTISFRSSLFNLEDLCRMVTWTVQYNLHGLYLGDYLFFEFNPVRQLTEEWMDDYKNRFPDESHNNLSPMNGKLNN